MREIGFRLAAVAVLMCSLSCADRARIPGETAAAVGSTGTLRALITVDQGAFPSDVTELTFVLTGATAMIRPPGGSASPVTLFQGQQVIWHPSDTFGVPNYLVADATVPVGAVQSMSLSISDAYMRVADPATGYRKETLERTSLTLTFTTTPTIVANQRTSVYTPVNLGQHIVGQAPNYDLAATVASTTLTRPVLADYRLSGETLNNVNSMTFANGTRVERAKMVNGSTGTVRAVALNPLNGATVDYGVVRATAATAWSTLHGAIDRRSYETLTASPGPNKRMIARIAVPFMDPFAPDPSSPLTRADQYDAYVADRVANNEPAVLDAKDALSGAGFAIESYSFAPPLISFTGHSTNVLDDAAFVPDIESLVLDVPNLPTAASPRIMPAVNAAKDLVQNPLWTPAMTFDQEILVAIWEIGDPLPDDPPCIFVGHSDFVDVDWSLDPVNAIHGPDDSDCLLSSHATNVAGALAGKRFPVGGTDFVGLFGGKMFLGNVFFRPAIASATAMRGAHFINQSSTSGLNDAETWDELAWSHRIMVVNAACQASVCGVGDAANCYAYNGLCVGGLDHQGTIGPTHFMDDSGDTNALFLNDEVLNAGREKPDVAASFEQTLPMPNGTHADKSGTSFSTPSITGTAALVMAAHVTELDAKPTLLRTVMLASARPVKDYTDESVLVATIGDGFDDKTGVGSPRGDRADSILTNDRFLYFEDLQESSFTVDGSLLATPQTFSAVAGQVVRVAVSWEQCPYGVTEPPDRLSLDLDLMVKLPGTVPMSHPSCVHSLPLPACVSPMYFCPHCEQWWHNLSSVENYEVVSFIAPITGTYQFNVKRTRWDDTCGSSTPRSTRAAIAWDVYTPDW